MTEVAKRLLQQCRDEDIVCRNGGDEFLYILVNPQGTENIERIAGAVLKNIAQPIGAWDVHLNPLPGHSLTQGAQAMFAM